MALTEFGKVIRKARIDADETLLSMSEALSTSPSFLSGMETGRKKISKEWVSKITDFFAAKKIYLDNLDVLADVANESIPVDGLPLQHQMLVAGFAKSDLTVEQLGEVAKLFEKILSGKNKGNIKNDK